MILWYICFNVFACILYASDKAASRHQQRRVSEKTLHLVGLLGGWPFALIMIYLLRHKNRKAGFVPVVLATAAINLVVLCLILNDVKILPFLQNVEFYKHG